MSKFSDWLGAVGGVLGFITTIALFIANLQNWANDPTMLHNVSVGAFLVFVLSVLWFSFKSSVSAQWLRWTGLIILYIFSAFYFVWVGTWNTKIENSLAEAQIAEPKNGEMVDMQTPFLMKYSNISENDYLWVVVGVPKYDKVYLWANNELQKNHNKDGVMSSSVQIGATTSVGDVFNIIVLLVDEKVNFSFQEYDKQCKSTGQCNGIILPDSGIKILDFRTVTRK